MISNTISQTAQSAAAASTFESRFRANPKSRLASVSIAFMALAYALLFTHLSGGGLNHLYSRSPYHRLQADALLHGHFALTGSIYQINLDLAWYNGQIQQIWGLGVALWLLPFDALWRLFGGETVPDRAALGFAVFLYALYVGFTALAIGRRKKTLGLIFALLFLFFPPFWILALGPQLVYEETVLYACLASQALLIAVLRFMLYRRNADYLLCCLLGALTGLIRPTHYIYAFAAITIATFVLLRRMPRPRPRSLKLKTILARNYRVAALGIAIFIAGLVFLAASNYVRFGAASEFGHTLTATPEMNLFFSRFSPPYARPDTGALVKELFAWLFLPLLNPGQPCHLDNLVYLQAAVPRWRDVYLPTFNLVYLALLLTGLTWGVAVLIRRLRSRGPGGILHQTMPRCLGALAAWTFICFSALFVFHLPLTSMSSRYIMDFSPAVLAGMLLAASLFHRHWPKATLVCLFCALAADLARTRQVPILNQPTTRPYIRGLAPSLGSTLDEFNGLYSPNTHPSETDLKFNGHGWSENGMAGPIVVLAVDAPKFIELKIDPRQGLKSDPDIYRARIGRYELSVLSTTKSGPSTTVRFEVPDPIRRRAGDELLFLCFVKTFQPQDRDSRRLLHSVQWR